MNYFLELFLKGIPIGMSNTLPGISGGTMALVLGIYDRLIKSLKRIQLTVLIPIFLGAVAGVLGSSTVITVLLTNYPNLVKAFLLGLIFASSKVTYDQVERFNLKRIGLAVIGLCFAYFYSIELSGSANSAALSYVRVFGGGAVGSIAMILPGISGGTVLIMLGLYQGVLEAISNFNLVIIALFGLGVGSGLLFFSWVLSYLLNHFRTSLMAFLTGLILGSMRSVSSFQLSLATVVSLLGGVAVIYLLSKVE
ncbi:MAG: DUF368 domain-containing protein [Bacillota bacterium]